MRISKALTVCSLNMSGFRNGFSMLRELCSSHLILGVQEHWLREDDLDKLNLIHSNYNYYAASGMNSAVASSILKGRPFGGVGFLWHKSLNSAIKPLGYSPDGRCIIIQVSLCNFKIILCNVYFPCFEHSCSYKDDISSLTAFIETILHCNQYNEAAILGDTNFD